MATAIGFKKVDVLPTNPLKSTFYWVGEKDIYYGANKLNNEEDIAAALERIEALEEGSAGGGTGGGTGSSRQAKNILIADEGNKFDATNVEDALAELMNKIGASSSTFDDFTVLAIEQSDWTGTENDGGRTWKTASLQYERYNDGLKVIRAVPCGGSLDIMATEDQERCLYAMKAYLYPDDKIIKFYSPTVPVIRLTVALEGVELDI